MSLLLLTNETKPTDSARLVVKVNPRSSKEVNTVSLLLFLRVVVCGVVLVVCLCV